MTASVRACENAGDYFQAFWTVLAFRQRYQRQEHRVFEFICENRRLLSCTTAQIDSFHFFGRPDKIRRIKKWLVTDVPNLL